MTANPCAIHLPDDVVCRVQNLQTSFSHGKHWIKSVDDVSFDIPRGKTLAVVGESGSGKSVTSLSMLRLLPNNGRITGGQVLYRHSNEDVMDLAALEERRMRKIRGRHIAMIFQEPMTSLNPLFTVGDQIAEMLMLHEPVTRAKALARAAEMLELVEIPAARQRLSDYPHHMSGGMRQRVMIAMALVCNPTLLIADEPTTALDVTVQAQIIALLRRLQEDRGMSIMFITHNLGVVAEIAHEVVVLYAGRVAEHAKVHDLFDHQKHPYTRGLLACIPDAKRDRAADGTRIRLRPIMGNVPPAGRWPEGCTFAPRCEYADDVCTQVAPPLVRAGALDHLSSCRKHEAL
ncbi:ABC transporter ATP-binding protein [Bordetella tumulicola]|uniref:ABC transporter ATP-binding protein n=1 Tax=Bordetella tumulicola TaxID=1649133 RepID=UPI0039EFBEB9